VPADVHDALRERASQRGSTLQQVAEEALTYAARNTQTAESSQVARVWDDRYSPGLAASLEQLLERSSKALLVGLTLLDFLSDEGWASGVLHTHARSGNPLRLAIQDSNSAPAHERLARAQGLSPDDPAIATTPKHIQLDYAGQLLEALDRRYPSVRVRRYGGQPVWRWLLVADDVAVGEPHTPRRHDKQRLAGGLMPVLELAEGSPASARLLEHAEDLWSLGQ
jgi:hypothetical protein